MAFLLTVCLIMLSCNDSSTITYPGYGFPIISKNKPIKILHEDISKYAGSFPGVKVENGKLIFDNVDNFDYVSTMPLQGKVFFFEVPVLIDNGECTVGIGNVSLALSQDTIVIYNNGKETCRVNDEKIQLLVFTSTDAGKQEVRVYSKDKWLKSVDVKIAIPAKISIRLNKGCKGFLGPWMWQRGIT